MKMKNLSVMLGVTALTAILLTAAVGLTSNSIDLLPDGNEVIAYPKQHKEYQHHKGGWDMKPGQYAAGTIAGLQNDGNGTAWIVSGHWKASMTEKKEGSYPNKNMSSTTANNTMSANSSLHNAKFIASFDMVMPNGTAMHDHKIYNFTLTDMSMRDNHTMVYNGTATITMRGGPVNDVPMSIMVMNGNTISISSDSELVANHFGDTPIYGTVTKAIKIMK
jgi:hypothetical protein